MVVASCVFMCAKFVIRAHDTVQHSSVRCSYTPHSSVVTNLCGLPIDQECFVSKRPLVQAQHEPGKQQGKCSMPRAVTCPSCTSTCLLALHSLDPLT